MHISINSSRRRFLKSSLGGATAVGIGAAVPACFAEAAQRGNTRDERILVVVQLSGGNDGLNTVIPYTDEEYRRARPKLAIEKSSVIPCGNDLGLHPAMSGMGNLYEAGQLAIIQGVGYDQPNRSHFESMDIWHTCRRKDQPRPDGWLGRLLDTLQESAGGDVPALHLGREQQPFAVVSQRVRVPTVRELAEFQLQGANRDALRKLLDSQIPSKRQETDSNALLSFLQASTTSALVASQRVAEAAESYHSEVTYPESELGKKLQVIAQLIDAGLQTRVYYVQLDGFDTHAQQPATHEILLREWSDAVSALIRDLDAHSHADRVCVMTFSEFGRRVAENASAGTDHGAAGPMFLCGGGVRAGVTGDPPNLVDLHDGDLQHQFDFRQVYASVLDAWFRTAPGPIVGEGYDPLNLFM
ncbi:DUF1501 domain-containing protein [Aureliella helgolandensis]|uniref:DUF1501 domain-containing protein n=1 Tax=Aureliella helgolandensis TaxID=2527968 RepID=A0A518G2B7_9BACT|nr:DUF1501 domain-containing protein [Aureliella helgolandensis]QDV22710.1 hypothetical protein Q31a_09960 [Aureliella helgolandensis]